MTTPTGDPDVVDITSTDRTVGPGVGMVDRLRDALTKRPNQL